MEVDEKAEVVSLNWRREWVEIRLGREKKAEEGSREAAWKRQDKKAVINSKRWDDKCQSNILVLSQETLKV